MKIVQNAAFVWFVFILFVVVFAFLYSILSKPIQEVYNITYNDSAVHAQVYQNFFIRSKTIWFWFPLAAVLVVLFWAWLKVQESDPYGSGG